MMQQTPRRLARKPPFGEVPVLDQRQELAGAVAGVADLAPFVASLAVVVHIFHVEHGLKKLNVAIYSLTFFITRIS